MTKHKFKAIVRSGIYPPLKEVGFKKSGNHFIKKLDETQQVVTLQLSRGNTQDRLRFYFRCGILINALETEERDLKSEVFADYRFDLGQITDAYDKLEYDIISTTEVESTSETYREIIESDLIPFFSKLEMERDIIEYLISRDSLQTSIPLIKFLCRSDSIMQLEKYMVRLTKFLRKNEGIYNDPSTALKRVDKMICLIDDLGKMTPELDEQIRNSW